MKIILDTNCFISSIGKKSPYRNVFDAFLNNKFVLCLSTEILLEYEEIFLEKWGDDVTENLLARIIRASNIELCNPYFDFKLSTDEDDNKFINTYLSSNADYLVSNDSDIIKLKNNGFPKMAIKTLQEFSQMLKDKAGDFDK